MGKKKQKQSSSIWVVAGVAVTAVAVLVGASIYSSRSKDPAPVAQSDEALGVVRGVRGSATAKVTVVEYSDYL